MFELFYYKLIGINVRERLYIISELFIIDMDGLKLLLREVHRRLGELHRTGKKVDLTSSRLTGQYEKAVEDVSETFNYFVSCLNERRTECLKELEQAYSGQQD